MVNGKLFGMGFTMTHLLMLRLFFLDPKRPCIKTMGDFLESLPVAFGG